MDTSTGSSSGARSEAGKREAAAAAASTYSFTASLEPVLIGGRPCWITLPPRAEREVSITPTSPSSIGTAARGGNGSSMSRTVDLLPTGAEAVGDTASRSPSPDSPAPFSYTAPGATGHGRAAAAAPAGGEYHAADEEGGTAGTPRAMGTPELSPKSAAIGDDVSSLAALVAAASPPSSTMKRYALLRVASSAAALCAEPLLLLSVLLVLAD